VGGIPLYDQTYGHFGLEARAEVRGETYGEAGSRATPFALAADAGA
jgi:hypothetical protein